MKGPSDSFDGGGTWAMAADSITTSCGVFHTRKKNHAHSLRVQRRTAALLVAMPIGYCLPSRAPQKFWGQPKVGSKYKMCTVSFSILMDKNPHC